MSRVHGNCRECARSHLHGGGGNVLIHCDTYIFARKGPIRPPREQETSETESV